MLATSKNGPEGFPWVVTDEKGAPVAAAPTEAQAERLAFLLGSYAAPQAAPRPLLVGGARVPYAGSRPAAEPAPVIVVREGGGREVARIPASGPLPETPAAAPVAPADPVVLREGWTVGDATIERRATGYAVAFPSRPAVHVRGELKAAGFRWHPEAGEWRGVRLPARFLPVRSGGAS